jgi:uncharacterized membrane protein YoaK (UPF0700 family)
MQRYSSPLVSVAVCLAALAGFVDALAFQQLGLFASFMSGNSTRIGVGLGAYDPGTARLAGALVLSFVTGVVVASIVARRWEQWRKPAVMTVVTLLLAVARVVADWHGTDTVLLLAVAMGAANGVFIREGEVSIGVTYMTGSLVRLGQRLAGALMGDGDRWAWLPYLALWGGFIAGAVLGARAYAEEGLDALTIAIPVSAVITLALAWLGRPARIKPAA